MKTPEKRRHKIQCEETAKRKYTPYPNNRKRGIENYMGNQNKREANMSYETVFTYLLNQTL